MQYICNQCRIKAMQTKLIITKMPTKLESHGGITYRLSADIIANDYLGKELIMEATQKIFCKNCGKKTKKSFAQGFCFVCFSTAPQNADCILRPELCLAHLGQGRNPEWEQDHHFQPHVVYLALGSVLKVGVTRTTQMPTRWIDQGASQVVVLAELPYRQLAGEIEVFLKQYLSDKTPWQKMLKNEMLDADVLQEKERIVRLLPAQYHQYISQNQEITTLNYPVLEYPTKLTSLKLDTSPVVQGTLMGIKAQYLIFDGGRVLNMRSHEGYEIILNH